MNTQITKGFPKNKDHKWIPFIWLPYFGFFLLQPVLERASRKLWLLDGIGAVFFFIFFFGMFWDRHSRQWFHIAGMLALGVLLAPVNGGAATFFIYAGAFAPFLAGTELGAVRMLLAISAIAATETWALHLGWWFFLYAAGFPLLIGGGNIVFAARNRANEKLRKANDEIEHLAKVAERERIARDLHDVLGHTLSVIILKSELAGKLIDTDPERAKVEIRDVERISRAALADVRITIRGYRNHSLEAEIKQAKATLETAGVAVKSEEIDLVLTPVQESVVALLLREAVTNVVRHAQARNCQLRLAPMNGSCLLEIEDDGRGGLEVEGNGLRGMRERVQALGGTLERVSGVGTKLRIQFPLTPAKANGNQ